MIAALRGLYARPGDRDQIATREARVLADAMERFIRFRDRHPELADRFIDVKYSELVFGSLGCHPRDLSTSLILHCRQQPPSACANWFPTGHGIGGISPHDTLADLGFDVSAETRRFNRYCLRFGVPCQAVPAKPKRMKKFHAVLLSLGVAFLAWLVHKIGVREIWHELTLLGWGLVPLILCEGVAELIHTSGMAPLP